MRSSFGRHICLQHHSSSMHCRSSPPGRRPAWCVARNGRSVKQSTHRTTSLVYCAPSSPMGETSYYGATYGAIFPFLAITQAISSSAHFFSAKYAPRSGSSTSTRLVSQCLA